MMWLRLFLELKPEISILEFIFFFVFVRDGIVFGIYKVLFDNVLSWNGTISHTTTHLATTHVRRCEHFAIAWQALRKYARSRAGRRMNVTVYHRFLMGWFETSCSWFNTSIKSIWYTSKVVSTQLQSHDLDTNWYRFIIQTSKLIIYLL